MKVCDTVKSIAILGAGNAGIASAADMKSRGYEVRLFELPEYEITLDRLRAAGKITLTRPGKEPVEAVPDLYTTDIKQAVEGADVIMFTINTLLTERFSELLAPVVTENQVLFFNGAAEMAPVRFANKAKELGIEKNFNLCETSTLTYGCRANAAEGTAHIGLDVRRVCFAAYPASKTEELYRVCSQLYPYLFPGKNIFHTFLENMNAEVHPGPVVLNAGRVESMGDTFNLYEHGMTPSVIRVVLGVEKERRALGAALDIPLIDGMDMRHAEGYVDEDITDLHYAFTTQPTYMMAKGPSTLQARYLTEDAPMALALYTSLGHAIGVDVSICESILTLAGCLMDSDYKHEGLTLERLGWGGYTRDQLIEAVS